MLKPRRLGRSGGTIAIGLFLLSGVLVLPALQWTSEKRLSEGSPDEYRFADTLESFRPEIKTWHTVDGFPRELAQLETVFWAPDDTDSLRQWLENSGKVPGARVLEIGTGTGLVAICCALHGASQVVATDINPYAVVNAKYNADWTQVSEIVEVRQVSAESPGPFSVVRPAERFDLIVSNPPWEDDRVEEVAAYALYDPGFQLLDGLLKESAEHLSAGGRLLLAYGARTAIARIQTEAPKYGWRVQVRDDRRLEDLPEVFLPGMLLELVQDPALQLAPHLRSPAAE